MYIQNTDIQNTAVTEMHKRELDKEKGDVILKYRPNQVAWLRKNGYLEQESMEF